MNHFIKLLNFELKRASKLYVVLLLITLISQFIGVIVLSKRYMNEANTSIYKDGLSKLEFIQQFGQIEFSRIISTLWYSGPIAFCAAALIFYVFLIWYRDWFGKNTFIYRLLMLPTSRLNIYFSKVFAIFLMVLGLIAFELILLPIQIRVFHWIVPSDFRLTMDVKSILLSNLELSFIIPTTFSVFLVSYGIGLMAVIVVFTAILLERCYRLKGIILGVFYCALAVAVFLLPMILMVIFESEIFYPGEFLLIEILLSIIITGGSIWISRYLLNRKITV